MKICGTNGGKITYKWRFIEVYTKSYGVKRWDFTIVFFNMGQCENMWDIWWENHYYKWRFIEFYRPWMGSCSKWKMTSQPAKDDNFGGTTKD